MKVYILTIKETGVLISTWEVYDSLEKAVDFLKRTVNEFLRKLEPTDKKNEFRVLDEYGKLIHTIEIVDVWIH